jgi:hypothetical protein
MAQMYADVSYETLKNVYKKYTWDATIGNIGGFRYERHDGTFSDKGIEMTNIGSISVCENCNDYSNKSECLGISKTSIDLPNVFKGTDYGWDAVANKWVYFTDETQEKPTHYSDYLL